MEILLLKIKLKKKKKGFLKEFYKIMFRTDKIFQHYIKIELSSGKSKGCKKWKVKRKSFYIAFLP